jgi:malonyl-CoA O-methyltransferase
VKAAFRLPRFRSRTALEPQQAYALWADVYPPTAHNPLMLAEQAIVAPMIQAARPKRAVDVGTGTGRYLPLLRQAGARFVVGVDLSAAMLRRNPAETCIMQADACRLPIATASVDLVCSSLMVGDVKHVREWTREASRVLAPGGHLIYSDFHPSWAEHGWTRTFRTTDDRLLEVSFHPHSIDDHLSALEDAGLQADTIREPRLATGSPPVVVIFHAVKPR